MPHCDNCGYVPTLIDELAGLAFIFHWDEEGMTHCENCCSEYLDCNQEIPRRFICEYCDGAYLEYRHLLYHSASMHPDKEVKYKFEHVKVRKQK